MKSTAVCVSLFFLASALAQRGGGTAGALREVTVTAIPGVVAAGAKWQLAWQGTDNADGIVGTKDGGLLFAQEQPNRISKVGKNGKVSVFLEDTHGTGALTVDSKGRILAVERTCTDPGKQPDQCKEPTAVVELAPQRKILSDNVDGKSLGRLNDLIADKKGGVYFNGSALFYLNSAGKVSTIDENIRTNGITLSPDEKTLYVTNGGTIVAFDVQPDGSVRNQRDFGKLEAGTTGGAGDGMTIDAAGRIYVTTGAGVQVLSPEGKYLGLIPTPRGVISVAFSGPGKKTLYVVGGGAIGLDNKEISTPPGVRNNAKSIYKITMLAEGFKGRVK
ncbi:MAG TPA: SMP-30/gluconolactonase/LRE family protein [Bryobacteraceae bacterium]